MRFLRGLKYGLIFSIIFWAIIFFCFSCFALEEDLYVNAFDATMTDWTGTGDSPYLGAADADYITATGTGQEEYYFTFENASDSSGQTINSVVIWFRVNADTSAPEEMFEVELDQS